MSTARNRTLIVVPAFNEEESIANVVREIFTCLPEVSCLVVDDGSSDSTAVKAEEAGAFVARLPFNVGVGGAMRLGFRFAQAEGYTNVVQVDGDGQHDPKNVKTLLEALDSADLVLGSRFSSEGGYHVTGPRRWAMILLSIVLSKIAGTRLEDTTSGFRASGPKAVRLFVELYPAEYLGDTIESLVIASRSKLVIREVAVSMRVRAGGVPSHNPFRSALYLARACMALGVALIKSPVVRS